MRPRGTKTEGVLRITGHTDRTGLLGLAHTASRQLQLMAAKPQT